MVNLVGEDPNRKGILVYNNGTETVYILGAKGQTSTDGIPLAAGASYEDDTSTGELFIVAASGTQDVRVMTIGD